MLRPAKRASKTLPDASEKARDLEGQADSLQAEAEALKGAARLEDLSVWVDGEDQDHQEGQPVLWLLDGLMESG